MTSLSEAFEIKSQATYETMSDYEVFKDKELLDNLREKVITSIANKTLPKEEGIKEFIDDEINKNTEGFDLSNIEREHLFNLIYDEICGYGPITTLLNDSNVTEIMVNAPDQIYIEVNGEIIKEEDVSFINENHILRTINRLIEDTGEVIDANNPIVDVRINEKTRINAVIPPLSLNGPIITIKKYQDNIATIDELIGMGTLTIDMAKFLYAAVKAKLNIVISGGSGSGKSTLLSILTTLIPEKERVIVIENNAELRIKRDNIVFLESKKNQEKGFTTHDLVINSLKMRPDRIIVSECQGNEAFDMLEAMNTGHDGSITTIHASSPKDAFNRLVTMILMSDKDFSKDAISSYLNNAVDLIINIERMSDGKRKITNISEVTNLLNGAVETKDIFIFRQIGIMANNEVNGEFLKTNYIPFIYNKIKKRGIKDIDYLFKMWDDEKPMLK